MKALILAAGYATRLYPLTKDKPKPLLPIVGKPIIEYLLEKISSINEIDKVYIVTNNKFYSHFKKWQENFKFNKKIEIINDNTLSNETRLGGVGDLYFVIEKKKIDDDILVVLGDNIFEFNLNDMVEFFKKANKTMVGVYDINDFEEAKKFGILNIKNGKVVSFEEKPQNPKSTIISTGIYIYTKSDLEKIKEYIKTDKNKDGPGYLVQYLVPLQDVYGFKFSGKWFDIGSKEQLQEANKEYKSKLYSN